MEFFIANKHTPKIHTKYLAEIRVSIDWLLFRPRNASVLEIVSRVRKMLAPPGDIDTYLPDFTVHMVAVSDCMSLSVMYDDADYTRAHKMSWENKMD